jgi:LmbE family N-acetylglucosaminyl deacetylase
MVTILSPHLDDAVLSCWHLLTEPHEVTVINVFAGAPLAAPEAAWWDRLTGATDSAKRMLERWEEDRRALALAGRTAQNLGFLDDQYRDWEQPLEPLVTEIASRLEPGALICAPAALGDHPDHALVRAAALELRQAGAPLSLYADLPHAALQGWPAWVPAPGATASHDLAGALWERALASTGVAPAAMVAAVHRLDRSAHERKLEAVRAYATQFRGLADWTGRRLSDHVTLGYEVVWTLPVSATQLSGRAGLAPAPRRADSR